MIPQKSWSGDAQRVRNRGVTKSILFHFQDIIDVCFHLGSVVGGRFGHNDTGIQMLCVLQ
jgi:hypothetical protein